MSGCRKQNEKDISPMVMYNLNRGGEIFESWSRITGQSYASVALASCLMTQQQLLCKCHKALYHQWGMCSTSRETSATITHPLHWQDTGEEHLIVSVPDGHRKAFRGRGRVGKKWKWVRRGWVREKIGPRREVGTAAEHTSWGAEPDINLLSSVPVM